MDRIYKATDSVVAREIAGETMLVPVTGHLADLQSIYALDDISSLVWNLLDGKHGIAEVVDAVVAQYDISRTIAETDIRHFIDDLTERKLLVEA